MSDAHGSRRAILYALVANAGIALAKFVAAFVTGSGSLLAEAVHSLADCGNQLLLMWGMKQARGSITEDHPLGQGRVIYFYSMLVALLLFLVGGLFSVVDGIRHLSHPGRLSNPIVALSVLGVSVVLEAFSLRGALKEVRSTLRGRSMWRWFRETRQPELLVVTGEDIAALCGLAIAFVAVLLTVITKNPIFDALGGVAVGFLLMLMAVLVMREVKSLIVGESAEPALRAEIRAHIAARPEVVKVISLITLQWGEELVIAVQAQMAPQPSADALVDAINVVEESIQTKWPNAHWVFFEPDHAKN